MASCFGWVLTQGTVTLVLVKIVCKTLCVCVCANTSILCAYVSVFVIYWDTRGPDCPWNIGHTPTLSSLAFCPAWKEDRTRMKCERRSLFLSPRLLSLDLFKKKIFLLHFSPLLALLIAVSPVQSTLAVQQVHVATERRLLTANHSAVQPLAPPFYVTQEMLHRHILGRARVHGIEDQW